MAHRKTQLWDGFRSFFISARLPLRESIAMLVLIKYFDASDTHKTLLPVYFQLGMLLPFFFTNWARWSELPLNRILQGVNIISALGLVAAACSGNVWLFVLAAGIPGILQGMAIPLATQIYGAYEPEQRGKRYSTSALATFFGSICFAGCAQLLLRDDIALFRIVLLLFSLAFLGAAYASRRLPEVTVPGKNRRFPLADFSLLKKDGLFGYLCLMWFIAGTSVHWLGPYRTNLLAEERFGFEYSPWLVILVVSIIPDAVRILVLPIVGRLFDRVNFIVLRMMITSCLLLYAFCFFFGGHLVWHVVGMIFLGIAMGGGNILWSLWVTKLVPVEKVPAYMAVHTTLTGLRLTLAPLVGLWCLANLGPKTCALMSCAGFGAAVLMLFPVVHLGRTRFKH